MLNAEDLRWLTVCDFHGRKSEPMLQIRTEFGWRYVEHIEKKDHEDETAD